ncbi:MAG TPA: tetratricopeptide repeat protein [Verrucomicrobiae bacterium]|nr:tetratricopeptide repeat protein [Verrucomicrobiae bacterium]
MKPEPSNRRSWWLGVSLAILALVVYGNNLHGPFILDDVPWILNNPNIRTLWPLWKPLLNTSRPVVQWSLAANYAIGGLEPIGYHLVNNLIHALAGLALFGVVRRTLRTRRLADRFGESADGIAFAVALLWAVHPLDTESVTYVIQRAESMAGLFAVLTLYCVIRGAMVERATAWNSAAILSCALAVGSKPVAAVVPFLALAYDWIFLAGGWSELWRKRWRLYVGLGASWLLATVFLAAGKKEWMGSAGVVSGGRAIGWIDYAMLQPQVIVHYLRLSLWPDNLCLLYGRPQQSTGLLFWLFCAVIGGSLLGTAWLLARRSPRGFLGAWFFVALAPTSSVIPLLHPMFEHRMYLPLMAVVAGIVCGMYWLLGEVVGGKSRAWVWAALVAMAGVALGATTIRRNMDYRTEVSIWQDTARKAPMNPDAQYGLALALATAGQIDEASAAFAETMRLKPEFSLAEYDWGRTLEKAGREMEALEHFRAALRIDPRYAEAEDGIGVVLYHQGKLDEAIQHFFEATRLNPNDAQAQQNLAEALREQKQQRSTNRK